MKLGKRLFALTAAFLLAVSLTVPASARGWHGGCHDRVTAAAAALSQEARAVLGQARARRVCLRDLAAETGKLGEFQAELSCIRDNCRVNGDCPYAEDNVCPNQGVCDGTGRGYGCGNGGQGRGGHHGGGCRW